MPKKLLASIAACTLILAGGCCEKKTNAPEAKTANGGQITAIDAGADANKELNALNTKKSKKDLPDYGQGNFKYSIEHSGSFAQPPSSSFETEYIKGVELIENARFAEAISFFNNMLKAYPKGEEASMLEFCIAEVYFRMKNDKQALELFKQIIQKYPNTQAAENAQAGITYLENFDKYADKYVSPQEALKKVRQRW